MGEEEGGGGEEGREKRRRALSLVDAKRASRKKWPLHRANFITLDCSSSRARFRISLLLGLFNLPLPILRRLLSSHCQPRSVVSPFARPLHSSPISVFFLAPRHSALSFLSLLFFSSFYFFLFTFAPPRRARSLSFYFRASCTFFLSYFLFLCFFAFPLPLASSLC